MAVTWITGLDLATPASPYAAEAAEAASQILYALSGERYPGVQETTEVYVDRTSCPFGCRGGTEAVVAAFGGLPHSHVLRVNEWYPTPWQLRLRHKPVVEVIQVLDATATPITGFYTANSAYLVRNNEQPWDITRGIAVTYRYGSVAPAMARNAAIRFGNELLKSWTGAPDCALPERVTSISRQGVSINIVDPTSFIDKGQVGLYEVDLFLAAVNPSRARKRARVFSVDRPRGERRT